MKNKRLKIVLLFDLGSEPLKGEDFLDFLGDQDMKTESQVFQALQKLGHEVRLLGIHDDILPLENLSRSWKPDLVFNLSEAFKSDRKFEPHLVALLELLGIRHTGADSSALRLCKDKGLTKKILSFHEIRVPEFLVSYRSRPLKSLKGFKYPAIIKPLGLEASEGISLTGIVRNEADCLERIKFLQDRYETDVIIEEFISGRELYVGVMGNEKVTVLPPRELFFSNVDENDSKVATYKAKWDERYRKRKGIHNGHARRLSSQKLAELEDICKKIYRLFEIKGYARVDLRLTPEGEIVFLEANPNPCIGRDEDFALSAKKSGLKYEELIDKLVRLAKAA